MAQKIKMIPFQDRKGSCQHPSKRCTRILNQNLSPSGFILGSHLYLILQNEAHVLIVILDLRPNAKTCPLEAVADRDLLAIDLVIGDLVVVISA